MGHPLRLLLALALLGAGAVAPARAEESGPDPSTRQLGASIEAPAGAYTPGQPVALRGSVYALDVAAAAPGAALTIPATFRLQVRSADGRVRPVAGTFATESDGSFAVTLPGAASAGLVTGPETDYRTTVAVEVVDVEAGERSVQRAGAAAVTFAAAPGGLQLHNSYLSPTGWVKPGETYPFRVFARNFAAEPSGPATVTIPAVDGTTFTTALASAGHASVGPDGAVTWAFDGVPAATDAGPGVVTLVVEGRADTLAEDPQVVWKNLSSLATLAAADGRTAQSASHGPKVIPQDDVFDTARYGDRPFPVVPVDYFDRKHEPRHPGSALADKINSPAVAGSTFNLYQEMSYGQLYPQGDVPSAGIATAGWDYPPGFAFTEPRPQGTCTGTTFKDQAGSELYPERIRDGWYQLPGTTGYYGADRYGSALPGALTGVGLLFDIDSACGPAAKAVYDAAQIADPELDYSDFDTDKDGVVDFFMMVFVGLGGNGASQTEGIPPYDNVWPHSSSLEFTYVDPESGLRGYVSDDQLTDHQGRPLFYTDAARAQMTTEQTAFPVFVRVGPYNVNPETSIEHASVISHEYGHSLGLPDFYSVGDRETYGDWNLMATDKSQHMDVFGKQELGWVVPRLLAPGDSVVTGWVDSKANTGRIDWVDPAGRAYTLQGPGVANGQAYMAKLPPRQIIDPAVVAEQASGTHLWWSRSGNDFGCPPDGGHNLDIVLPELAELPAGSPVRVQFKSRWDIEWDFDYGFVLVSTDGGRSYRSLPSANGYSTPQAQNPNNSGCQGQYGNGLTGSSGSYAAGSQEVDRLLGEYPEPVFVDDAYDLTAAAGSAAVLRFSYATDVGLARPGWFIDDLRITAGDRVIYETDFETAGGPDDPRVFNGGCKDQLRVAARCTDGWLHVDAGGGSPADHAYYLELRDRSGFDFDGHGENDRDPIGFEPGLLLVYSDEAHGYGNVGTDNPPAQSPLDAVPEPGSNAPDLNDAAFKPAQGRSRYSDSGPGHVDNYSDPRRPPNEQGFSPWLLDFDCLSFDVLAMTGDEVGPATAPGDLAADVAFSAGPGCARFDYGLAGQDIVGPADAVERVAGADRIQTAVELSRRAFESAPTAVVARADDFPDALAAAGLAAEAAGPVLLTGGDHLDLGVSAELERLGVDKVYLAGGNQALSPLVELELTARGYDTERLAGADRFATAGRVAAEIVELGGPVNQAVVARGDDFADALAAGTLATAGRAPVLLTLRDRLPDATSQALEASLGGATVFIAGGPAAVGQGPETQLRNAGYAPRRLAGADRFGTAVAIVEQASAQGADVEPTLVASGLNFPDALAAAPAAHALGGAVMLVHPTDVDASVAARDWLARNRALIDTVFVAGGSHAVSEAALARVRELIADP